MIQGKDVPNQLFHVAIITPVIHYCMGGLEIDGTQTSSKKYLINIQRICCILSSKMVCFLQFHLFVFQIDPVLLVAKEPSPVSTALVRLWEEFTVEHKMFWHPFANFKFAKRCQWENGKELAQNHGVSRSFVFGFQRQQSSRRHATTRRHSCSIKSQLPAAVRSELSCE